MAWVNSEYAGELAVLSTWLVALAPWSVSVFGTGGITVVALRFLPFRLQFIFGATIANERPFLWAWEVAGFQQSPTLTLAGHLGFVAFLLITPTFLLSVYYYFEEDRITAALPADPVRILGASLGLLALCTLTATGLFVAGFPGMTLPVGSLLAGVLAALLLTAART